MSRRRRRRLDLRPVLRLWPLFRPYLGRMLLLVLAAAGFSMADAGRAFLVEPLVNDVLLHGGEVRGQAVDELLEAELTAAHPEAVARIAAVDAPDPAAVRKIQAELELAPAPPEGAAGGAAALLERTTRLLQRRADDLPPEDLEAWEQLAWGALLQREAMRAAGPDAEPSGADAAAAVALSMAARRRVHEAGFAVAFRALLEVLVWALALALALAVFHYAMYLLSRVLVARVFVDLQNRLAEHLLTLGVGFFERERRGDLMARLTADLGLVSNVIMTLSGDLLIHGIRLVFLVGSALYLSWQLSVGLVVLGGSILGPLRWWGKRIRRSARKRQGATGDVLEVLQQMLTGFRVVKAFQREDYEAARFRDKVQASTDAQERAVRARVASKAWLQLMNDVTVPLLFLAGGYLVVQNAFELDAGRFGAFLGLVLLMYLPTKAMGEAYNTLMDSLPAVDRVFELLEARPLVTSAPDARELEGVREGFRVEDLSFAYEGGEEVLSGVSFAAPAGSLVAMVGHTGSGKSTLVDLLARFHDPTGGRILVDGHDLREISLASYLSRLATVPQENYLFHATIRENIRYGRLDATDEEVEEAARLARIHEEILAQPGGYDYVVGERGGKLSGGQVQRVAIARAILKRPAVLILDEATSALDTRTERLVQEALEEAFHGRATTFVIAHRLSTVKRADLILVLDRGRLVEQGTHAELLERGGLYAGLVARQLEGRPAGGSDTGELDGPRPV